MWALSDFDSSGLPLDALSVCDNSDLPSDESGNLLNMIMDSSADEHVGSLADEKSGRTSVQTCSSSIEQCDG